jgi:uncharacterized damage-inducible protein DinB
MATAQTREETWNALLVRRWEHSCRKVADLAEVFPADKFEVRPPGGIRTFGEVLRHIAVWNQYVAASLRGKVADEAANELPADAYPNKDAILKELRRGAGDVAAALNERPGAPDSKAAELVISFVEHTSEHYGQLVVYARLNSIVPPASRA